MIALLVGFLAGVLAGVASLDTGYAGIIGPVTGMLVAGLARKAGVK